MIEIEWCGHISHVIACSESEEVCFKNVRLKKKNNNTKTPERHFTFVAYYSLVCMALGKLLTKSASFWQDLLHSLKLTLINFVFTRLLILFLY